jgi:hypothetical protein
MKNFGKIRKINQKTYNIMATILQKINVNINEAIMYQGNKAITLATKILHKTENTQLEINQNARNKLLEKTRKKARNIFFIKDNVNIEISNSFYPKITKKKTNENLVDYLQIKKGNFLILSPKFISSYIMNDLKLSRDKQIYGFENNFKSIVSRFCKKFLLIFKNNIIGIKIVFSGK